MLRKLLSVSLILIVSIFTQFSCQREQLSPLSLNQDISIQEAKAFMMRTQPNAKADGQTNAKRDEYWSLAQKLTYKNGLPVVVVPLTYNYGVPLVINGKLPENGKPFDKSDYAIQKKLFVYKDPKGKVQVDVVSIIPTEDGRKKHKKAQGDDFDGYVLAYDNTETVYQGGWFYKNGKATNRVRTQSTRNARTAALTLNDGGPCDILVYTPSDGSGGSAAYQGGSTPRPSTSFTDDTGAMWTLAYTITMSCGGAGPDNGEATGPTTNDPSFGDGNWIWNIPAPGSSGGGGGYGFGPPPPYEPFMITENGVTGGSPEENFFYDMEYNHSPFLFFSNEEKALMIDFQGLMYSVKNYVLETGQKPDLSRLLLASNASNQQLESTAALLIEEDEEQQLNQTEKNLLGFGTAAYDINLKKFYSDARRATIMTIINFGYDAAVHNGAGIANAFKHALLAELHAVTFTRPLGVLIAEAHETQPDTEVTARMDRWNNRRGFMIYDDHPTASLVEFSVYSFQAMVDGQLRYIAREGDQVLTQTRFF